MFAYIWRPQVRKTTELQLKWWGLDYFDLFLIHFPVSLKYVDPAERFPPGWHAADGKTVELGGSWSWLVGNELIIGHTYSRRPPPGDLGRVGEGCRRWSR